MTATNTSQLSKAFPEKLTILDLETTGLKATTDRVIEIGFMIIEGGHVVERYNSFINPKVSIPTEITQLTGITNKEIRFSPYFEDIADEIYEKINDTVLVAHNARFDYGFLTHEFKRSGIKYKTKPLCTVKLSRSLYPQYRKHNLDALIKRFNLFVVDRHRALSDVMLVYQFLMKLSKLHGNDDLLSVCNEQLKQAIMPPNLNSNIIKKLPKSAGVYYFYDVNGKLLYVGKSVNIRQRVLSHFSADVRNNQDMKLSPLIHSIDWQETNSDFSAQILESQEIKDKHPLYNKRLRRLGQLYHFQITNNKNGYLIPKIKPLKNIEGDEDLSIGLFRSKRQAENTLNRLADEFDLCHKLLGLDKSSSNRGCFQYQLKKCFGACVGEEAVADYNERFTHAIKSFQVKVWSWESAIVIADKNKDSDKNIFHLIDRWCYLGQFKLLEDVYDYGYRIANDKSEKLTLNKTKDNNLLEGFDLDIYKILVNYLLNPELLEHEGLIIIPLEELMPDSNFYNDELQ